MSDVIAPIDFGTADPLGAGRDAYARHAWQDAFDLLTKADALSPLGGADLEALAVASFFVGRADLRNELLDRAFAAYQAAGDEVHAAAAALNVAWNQALRGKTTVAAAWVKRAERILSPLPESYAHGYLALMQGELARAGGDTRGALALFSKAVEIATRANDRDQLASAQTAVASLKIASGSITEGIRILEEAAIAAVNGELTPLTAGITACQMISACRDLTDYQRAGEWIEMTDRWCQTQSVGGFPGVCRVHRAEIVALKGGWQRAEEELRKATAELERFGAVPVIADGYYAIGDLRRLQGDLAGAEEFLRQAHGLGRSPQPALALIRLAEGKVRSAAIAIENALTDTSDQLVRGRLLAAQVEIALSGGDIATARHAVDELGTIVEASSPPALRGGLAWALGRVLHADGDIPAATRELRSSLRLWREVGSAYEIARVRAALSRTLRAGGAEDEADLELGAARDEFERLGAAPDRATVEAELRELEERRSGGRQVRMAFVFTDIVGSTKLAEALGDAAWEQLLRMHDDLLRSRIARHGGRIVTTTGDGVFAAFESPRQALRAAIEIQRALAEHRRTTGFAPPVRIGVHAADATQRGDDFSGIGVHVAARIGALAAGGEILASSDAIAESGDVTSMEPREVEVRGVSAAVRVASVSWS